MGCWLQSGVTSQTHYISLYSPSLALEVGPFNPARRSDGASKTFPEIVHVLSIGHMVSFILLQHNSSWPHIYLVRVSLQVGATWLLGEWAVGRIDCKSYLPLSKMSLITPGVSFTGPLSSLSDIIVYELLVYARRKPEVTCATSLCYVSAAM